MLVIYWFDSNNLHKELPIFRNDLSLLIWIVCIRSFKLQTSKCIDLNATDI